MNLNRLDNPKFLSLEAAVVLRRDCRRAGKQVVLTNGVFDLLHTGHLFFLSSARALGDLLIVAINGDESVRSLKGPSRPVQNERERAYALGALSDVDAVVAFHETRLVREIEALAPDLYAKAGDYSLDTLDAGERRALEVAGSGIHFLPFLEGYSTTELIRKISSAAKTF